MRRASECYDFAPGRMEDQGGSSSRGPMRVMRDARPPAVARGWDDKEMVGAFRELRQTVAEMRKELNSFRARHRLRPVMIPETDEEAMLEGEKDLSVAMANLEGLGRNLMRQIVVAYRDAGVELPERWEWETQEEPPRARTPGPRKPPREVVYVENLDSPSRERERSPRAEEKVTRMNDPVAGVAPEGDIDDETLHVVYGGRAGDARLRRENARLRQQEVEMRGERKRLWTEIAEAGTESRRKRVKTNVALGIPIAREDIEAATDMFAREAAYQAELHANPYVQFCMDAANYANAGRDQYKFINSVYSNMMSRMYGSTEKTHAEVTKAMAVASDALKMIGTAARTFPGRHEDLNSDLPREVFDRMYRELSDAVRVKKERQMMLDALRVIARPDPNGGSVQILGPPIALTARRVLSNASIKAGLAADAVGVNEVIRDGLGRQILACAVGLAMRENTKDTSPLYQSRMDRGSMASKMSKAQYDLGEYVQRTWGRNFGSRSLESGNGVLGLGGQASEVVSLRREGESRRVRYTASGIPVSLGF